jgi:UDP-N-acetylmuramoyl-L-alanyl-D-glutamate--2,6-diaminopimelate ligase
MVKQLLYRLKRPFHFLKTGLLGGLPAQILAGFPARKLTILAITGTDGKTTSSTLLYHALRQAGLKVALLSTIGAYIGDEKIETGFHVTSPQPVDLHQFMRRLVNQGYTHLVLEVTSHGLYQYRTWGITPTIAGITNIAQEHLDYHLTYQAYVEAKALLFDNTHLAVLNADDQSYWRLRRLIKKNTHVLTYSQTDKLPALVKQAISQRFPEPYNRMNCRLVYQLVKALNISDSDFTDAITTFPAVPGRMEFVKSRKKFEVVIDFAHTPQALELVLTSLRQHMRRKNMTGELIAVYGAAGLRDVKKRPIMGEIGTRLADTVIFTAEDPRTENPWAIIRQMKEQLTNHHDRIISIVDRRLAIKTALHDLAKPGDLIAILGKGHEQSMCYGTTEEAWSDLQVVQELMNK